MGFTFSLNILFLFENGKPVAASSEWNFHFQMQYPFSECILTKKFNFSNMTKKGMDNLLKAIVIPFYSCENYFSVVLCLFVRRIWDTFYVEMPIKESGSFYGYQ